MGFGAACLQAEEMGVAERTRGAWEGPRRVVGQWVNHRRNTFRSQFTVGSESSVWPLVFPSRIDSVASTAIYQDRFPKFGDGDEPLGWIYKAEHYFHFFSVEDFKKVKMASFHLDGEPLQWFQWANCIRIYPRWEDFTQALCQEFGPSEFNDSADSLVKLR